MLVNRTKRVIASVVCVAMVACTSVPKNTTLGPITPTEYPLRIVAADTSPTIKAKVDKPPSIPSRNYEAERATADMVGCIVKGIIGAIPTLGLTLIMSAVCLVALPIVAIAESVGSTQPNPAPYKETQRTFADVVKKQGTNQVLVEKALDYTNTLPGSELLEESNEGSAAGVLRLLNSTSREPRTTVTMALDELALTRSADGNTCLHISAFAKKADADGIEIERSTYEQTRCGIAATTEEMLGGELTTAAEHLLDQLVFLYPVEKVRAIGAASDTLPVRVGLNLVHPVPPTEMSIQKMDEYLFNRPKSSYVSWEALAPDDDRVTNITYVVRLFAHASCSTENQESRSGQDTATVSHRRCRIR
jgi:hypothetical protein